VNSIKVRGYKLVYVFVQHTGLKNCIKKLGRVLTPGKGSQSINISF